MRCNWALPFFSPMGITFQRMSPKSVDIAVAS